jgi:tetratricopeptide (TPR) repeat protein
MKKWPIIGGIILLLALLFVGNDFYHAFQAKQNALKGIEAYEAGDCQTASAYFSKSGTHELRMNTEIANFIRRGAYIYGKRKNCRAFLEAVEWQAQGEFRQALTTYDELMSEEALVPPIQEQLERLFEAVDPTEMVDQDLCLELSGLRERGTIPDPETHIPPLYAACGSLFFEQGRYGESVTMYSRLLEEYEDHPLTQSADEKLAQALIREAEASGASTIHQPQRISSTDVEGAQVMIQNASPHEISLVFSGVETVFEELPPCDSCKNYTGTEPEVCPEEGPVGIYELPAGTYQVVVKSVGGRLVIPFTGEWTLRTGGVYYTCFYLVSKSEF